MKRRLGLLAMSITVVLPLVALLLVKPVLAAPVPTFPKRPPPLWTWSNSSTNLQAWIGQLEQDRRYGWHHNIHVQPLGGGGADPHNYHIYSNGQNAWVVFDSGTGVTGSRQRTYSGTSSQVAPTLANDIAGDNGDPTLGPALQQRKQGDVGDIVDALNNVNLFALAPAPDPNPAPGAPPKISPGTQGTGLDCVGYYDITVPMDPNRITTLVVDYGDGFAPDVVQIPQGSGPALFSFTHVFPMNQPYPDVGWDQKATIRETNASSTPTNQTFHGQPPFIGPGNFVGDFWIWGNSSGYDTSGALAAQTIGLQPYNDSSEAGTQTVNSTLASALHGSSSSCGTSRGCFKVYTEPTRDANAYALASGTYDINIINTGYTNHTTWSNPNGPCGGTLGPTLAIKVGSVTLDSNGKIALAWDAGGNLLSVANNIAGEFQVPTSFVTSSAPAEAGVCISDNLANAGDAPLTIR